jgi:hypothetical protein
VFAGESRRYKRENEGQRRAGEKLVWNSPPLHHCISKPARPQQTFAYYRETGSDIFGRVLQRGREGQQWISAQARTKE